MRRTAAAVALSLIESTDAFVQPVSMATNAAKVAASPADLDVAMFSEGDIGVLPPLGVFDPLGLIETQCAPRPHV